VQIEWLAQILDGFPEIIKARIVVINDGVWIADLGKAVDEEAVKAEFTDTAFQLPGRGVGSCIGNAANPPSCRGCRETKVAKASFARLATCVASRGSGMPSVPGALSARTFR
jgi:hypothetical protein